MKNDKQPQKLKASENYEYKKSQPYLGQRTILKL
jgi:hypothetical protein